MNLDDSILFMLFILLGISASGTIILQIRVYNLQRKIDKLASTLRRRLSWMD